MQMHFSLFCCNFLCLVVALGRFAAFVALVAAAFGCAAIFGLGEAAATPEEDGTAAAFFDAATFLVFAAFGEATLAAAFVGEATGDTGVAVALAAFGFFLGAALGFLAAAAAAGAFVSFSAETRKDPAAPLTPFS